MHKTFYSFLVLILLIQPTLKGQLFIPPPPRDTINRPVLQNYNYELKDRGAKFTVHLRQRSIGEEGVSQNLTGKFTFHKGNGLKVDLELKDNVVVGDWLSYKESYHSIGFIQTAHFVDGYKHGEEVNYDYNYSREQQGYVSYTTSVIQYNMGHETTRTLYWENGQLKAVESKDGDCIRYHKNGNIASEGKKERGEDVGLWNFYYEEEDSLLKRQNLYEKYIYYSTTYHTNGNIESKGTWHKKEKAVRLWGTYVYMDVNGDTLSHKYANNGIEQGFQISLKSGGEEHERYQTFYTTNEEGVVQGEYIQRYLTTGRLRVKGFYKDDGQRDGLWEYYWIDGRLYRTENFENGDIRATRTIRLRNRLDEPINTRIHLEVFPPRKREIDYRKIGFILFP